jgi:hypothetical protein
MYPDERSYFEIDGRVSMPNVRGVEFNANQSELVEELVRELLKDGHCAVYPVLHVKPRGELRIASTPIPIQPRINKGT